MKALRGRGWLVVVQHGGLYSRVGVSDLLVCAQGRFCALEVKTDTGRPTRAQVEFLADVDRHNGIARVVRSVEQAIREVEKGLDMAGEWDDLLDDDEKVIGEEAEAAGAVLLQELGGETTLSGEDIARVLAGENPVDVANFPQEGFVLRGSTHVEPFASGTTVPVPAQNAVIYTSGVRLLPEDPPPFLDDIVTLAAINDKIDTLIGLLVQVVERLGAPAPPVEAPKPTRKRATKATVEPDTVQTTLDDLL